MSRGSGGGGGWVWGGGGVGGRYRGAGLGPESNLCTYRPGEREGPTFAPIPHLPHVKQTPISTNNAVTRSLEHGGVGVCVCVCGGGGGGWC